MPTLSPTKMTSIPARSTNCPKGASYAVATGKSVLPLRRLIAPAVRRRIAGFFSGSYGRALSPAVARCLHTFISAVLAPLGEAFSAPPRASDSTSATKARTGVPVGPFACHADSLSRYAVPAMSR